LGVLKCAAKRFILHLNLVTEGENDGSVVLSDSNEKYFTYKWQYMAACGGEICKQQQIKQSELASFKSQYVKRNLKVVILKHPVVISSTPVGAAHVLKAPTDK
jgi:hypothetical protein